MTDFYDSARWGLIPAGSHALLYFDGRFSVSPDDAAKRFGPHRWITVYGGAAAAAHTGAIDFEQGNPAFEGNALPEWAQARKAMNCKARVYTSFSNLPRARALAGALPNVVFWLATLDGVQRTAGELAVTAADHDVTLPPDKVWAQQWKGGMTAAFDESVLMPGQSW